MVVRDIIEQKLKITESVVKKYIEEEAKDCNEICNLDPNVKMVAADYHYVINAINVSLKIKKNITDSRYDQCLKIWQMNNRIYKRVRNEGSSVVRQKIYRKLQMMMDKLEKVDSKEQQRLEAKWNIRNL